MLLTELMCAGCDAFMPEDQLLSFSCPNRGRGDVDHVLRLQADGEYLRAGWPTDALAPDDNPFARYRRLGHTWRVATAGGISDGDYVEAVDALSAMITSVDRAPRVTPLVESAVLGTWIKNETVNVAGSHKARHLIGTAIHLEVARRLGVRTGPEPILAIASCGNAALAAAVVARAGHFRLRVFLPPRADTKVVAQLELLGAERVVCERSDDDSGGGDPCYREFREAVSGGDLPFSCQGGDNALALLGGHTLGWELVEQSRESPFHHVFIQVGGGALASSIMQAFAMAKEAGIIAALPRFHAVQTDNAHPLARAWQRLASCEGSLSYARSHRSEFMWPWETEPRSIATGILDDETYDWLAIVKGLKESGGSVITVSESRLAEARDLAHTHTGIAVDATGTAGLAGLLDARKKSLIGEDQRCLVLFTGAIR